MDHNVHEAFHEGHNALKKHTDVKEELKIQKVFKLLKKRLFPKEFFLHHNVQEAFHEGHNALKKHTYVKEEIKKYKRFLNF